MAAGKEGGAEHGVAAVPSPTGAPRFQTPQLSSDDLELLGGFQDAFGDILKGKSHFLLLQPMQFLLLMC